MTGATTSGVRRSRSRARLALLAGSLLLLAAACTNAPSGTPPSGTPAATVEIAAQDIAFDRTELRVPADAPFAIRFENREAVMHNVSIRGATVAFVGELFSGPAERTYLVPALAAGEYQFICDLHPEMRGTLISEP